MLRPIFIDNTNGLLTLVGLIFILIGCNQPETKLVDHSIEKSEAEIQKPTSLYAELAYLTQAKLGEGALWNHKTQTFWWIDIEGKQFNIYDPKTHKNRIHPTKTRIGTVVPSTDGNAILATEEGILDYNINDKTSTLINPLETDIKNNRLNDGKCDPEGRLWVGSMNSNTTSPTGSLYKVSGSESTKMLDSIKISNGIVWTQDHKTMYYIDTPTGEIMAYNYDNSTGEITKGRVAVSIPKTLGFPDGMAIDINDNLWVGMWNGNAVINFDPRTGKTIQTINVPAHNVTACAFGGPNLDTLYITTARIDMSPAELDSLPLSGSLFKCLPGVKGVEASFYVK